MAVVNQGVKNLIVTDEIDEPSLISSDEVISQCTSLMLRRAARAASQFLEKYLEPVGLHASQFGILNRVSRAGSMTITRLSDEMSLDRTTVTRNLQIMERDNLVAIVPGSDRRIREVALTEHGKKVLKDALPLWQKAENALTTRLGKQHREALLTIVSAIKPPEQK